MNTCLIIHTKNQHKLNQLFDKVYNNINKKNTSIYLHSYNYAPWENENIKSKITSFSTYNAYTTTKNDVESIIEIVYKVKQERLFIVDEDNIDLSININKKDLLKLNLDTKYETIKWFLLDLKFQHKQKFDIVDDKSKDYNRFINKTLSSYFNERIIYIDGGMGDHIMSLPLLKKIGKDVYVCCKYPWIYNHLQVKGYIHWNDELFGGYKRFVYEYGSVNNSETIIDSFFEMYGETRNENDSLVYEGDKVYNNEIPKNKKWGLICTSAAKINNQDSNKDWKDIRWFKLVNELKKLDYIIIQVGSKSDNQIPNVDFKFLDRKISELAGLIDECSLWITVDTFFHHFAASIKPEVGICLTPFYNNHAKHKGVKYIEKDCGKNFYDRRWWLDSQQPERKECMDLIHVNDVLNKIKTKKKITIYSAGHNNDNCSNWRVFQQFVGLDDYEIIHRDKVGATNLEDITSDIIFMQRPVIYCLDHIRFFIKNNVKVIVDYDDPLPFVEVNNPTFKESISEFINTINECHLITTTTERMKNYFTYFTNTKCLVLPNIINPRFVNDKKINNGDKIIMGWFGSRGHIVSLEPIKDVIIKILDEFENVYFNIYSNNPDMLTLFEHKKTKFIPYNYNFSEFQDSLGEIDINVAPINESYTNLLKSNIRIILPGYKGIPSVATNFGEYKDLGKENVLLCETQEDWYNNLKKIITDKNLYKKYSNNIKNKINSELTFDKWVNIKRDMFNNI